MVTIVVPLAVVTIVLIGPDDVTFTKLFTRVTDKPIDELTTIGKAVVATGVITDLFITVVTVV